MEEKIFMLELEKLSISISRFLPFLSRFLVHWFTNTEPPCTTTNSREGHSNKLKYRFEKFLAFACVRRPSFIHEHDVASGLEARVKWTM